LFDGTDVNYLILDRQILLTTDPLEPLMEFANGKDEPQQLKVSGTVTDASTGEPMPGVNVLVKGTATGALTDANGRYTLPVSDPQNAVLVFSFIGYGTTEIPVAGQTVINASLKATVTGLDEVVVIGYGTAKRSDLTGSVGSVNTNVLQEVKTVNVEQAIMGQVAGVQVRPNDGTPGQAAQIVIRGVGSITAGSDPLFVVDGFPVDDLQGVNPNDIENIDILKDASATAIYGSRGSNGVVIITTKRGMLGRTQINLDVSSGLQKIAQLPHYMNAEEQAIYAYWAAYFRNIDDGNDVSVPPNEWAFKCPQIVLDILDGKPGTPDTDWFDEVMRVAPITRYNLSVSGGAENIKYVVSGEYLDQQGIILNSSFDRYSILTNIDAQLTKKLSLKLSLNPSYIIDMGPDPQGTGYGTTILGNAASINPYVPVYNEDGSYFNIEGLPEVGNFPNPVALANEVVDEMKRLAIRGNITAEYAILDELKLSIMAGIDANSRDRLYFVPLIEALQRSTASGSSSTSMGRNWITEYTLNYNKSIGQHQITGLLGFTSQASQNLSSSMSSNAYPNNLVPYLSAVSGVITDGTSSISEWSLISYLGRVNYIYKNKYYITASLRTDGSSRFGSDNKYGWFPSAALAWRISEENFLRDVNFLETLKLRTSFGITGNNNIGNYEHLATINNITYPLGDQPVGGFRLQRLPNTTLTWETQKSLNVGMDMSLFTGRFSLAVDYFYSRNEDLLLDVNIPSITGFSQTMQNIGKIQNTGLEFLLNTVNIQGEFNWTTDFNISFYKNEVLKLGPKDDPIISSRHITMVGEPIGVFYGLRYDGIFETQEEFAEGPIYNPGARNRTRLGDAKFVDYSGPDGVPDNIINSYDRVIIGSPYPDFYYGMTNRFSYKNFTLSIALQGVYGNEIGSLARTVGLRSEFRVNQLALANNFWISEEEPGDGNTPRPNDEPTGGIREWSTRHLDNGSYLRINNISLNYQIPGSICQKLSINSLRVYIVANNPFIFTDYEGFNPDVNRSSNSLYPGEDNNNYPLAKSLSLGFNIGF
jgi:TonB-linked SusC/RagA family outer membrane protein